MAARMELLDQALAIGREELGFLTAGDVMEAERRSQQRDQLIRQAIADLDQENLESLADKLIELKKLQENLTGEAKKLRASLKDQLLNIKKQNKRISGYSAGAGYGAKPRTQRFINKAG